MQLCDVFARWSLLQNQVTWIDVKSWLYKINGISNLMEMYVSID